MNAAIDSWIAELDSIVFLSIEQSAKIEQHLQEELAGSVSVNSPITLKQANQIVAGKFGQADSLDELISDKQTERRKAVLNVGGSRVGWGSGPNR